MNKGIAILLVLVMSMGTMASAFGSTEMTGPNGGTGPVYQSCQPEQSKALSNGMDTSDPMLDYLRGLDPYGPYLPKTPGPGDPLPGSDSHPIGPPIRTEAILLYQDPNEDKWSPLPTRDDMYSGKVAPVTFENGTVHEIHGKLFEQMIEENTTCYDDIGIPSVPISIEFDGTPVAQSWLTGNGTAVIDPFIEFGNGTFQFVLDFIKPAGEYELVLTFDGWPLVGEHVYRPLTYTTIVYVNHPTIVDMDVSPDSVTVGHDIQVSGSLADDTGTPISSVPLQIWFDDELLGPSSDGVYIDDVQVQGANFSDDFEVNTTGRWSTYSAPGSASGDQWELGSPVDSVGPVAPHSGSHLWGTVLDGNYQRGAWSFLVTPNLDLTSAVEYHLSFFAWWSVYWEEDVAYVLASGDGGVTWDESSPMTFMGATLIQDDWTYYEFNVTGYKGSDNVKFAIVFFSADKTLDVRSDATFAFKYPVPMDTTADRHRVTVRFEGNLLFRPGQSWEDVDVKRITHFEFEQNVSRKIGYRNHPVKLVAWLKDNMGEVPSTNIHGHVYFYQVAVYWDKSWTIDDGIGDDLGPPNVIDRETGGFLVTYVVDRDQSLGPANVTFRFPGDDYYTSSQQVDVYFVKAHVYILPPPVQERRLFRGQALDIDAELRIVPEESIDPIEPGDRISGGFIKVFWDGQQIANRRTDFAGQFSVDYLVPSTHPLGDVPVRFEYDGSSLYEPVTLLINYTVISETFITFEGAEVQKGAWVYINGTIRDDKGQPAPNVSVTIIWKRAPEIGRVITDHRGNFSLQYYIEYEDKIGNITVIARFGGNKIYMANESIVIYTVKTKTLLERRDVTATVVRGEEVKITASLYENWGGYRGVEIQREIVTLTIDGVVAGMKRTAFDGSVMFSVPIESGIFGSGMVDVVLEFNGTEFYQISVNSSKLLIEAGIHVESSKFYVNDRPFDLSRDAVRKGDTVQGRILVHDDEFYPIPNWNVSVYYKDEGQRARLRPIGSGLTDQLGFFDYEWTFDVNTIGNKSIIVECEGLPSDGLTLVNFTYLVPPMSYNQNIIDTIGDHHVTIGSKLRLEVAVRQPGGWDMANLRFSLISAPEGMVISSEGIIEWEPTEGQMGKHDFLVWLGDGKRNQKAEVTINVAEESSSLGDSKVAIIALSVGALVAVMLARNL